jgi:thiol-disulfide isomerase/thioredoxin
MKKSILLISFLAFFSLANAQYFQNFDTLNHGDFIGVNDPNWTTWSNNPGSAEDAQVDSNMFFSPNNSIYFQSTNSAGGPQDAVLNFGSAFNTGDFVYEHQMYISQNKGAYFNVQAETTIGTTWALNCHFIDDGMMYIDDGFIIQLTDNYPVAQWFKFELKINLNTNNWEIYINDTLKSSFQNPVNKVASIDYFPLCSPDYNGNGQSEFWLDDVGFDHTAYTLPTTNAAVTYVGLKHQPISGLNNYPTIKIRNLGTTAITSFDLEVDYNGSQIQKSVSSVNIASLDFYELTLNQTVLLSSADTIMTASITGVNGNVGDDDNSDDSKTYNIDLIIPATGKVVIVEEATGTWCGWCPRGAVALDFLARDYHGIAQGIAVHNNDPMVDDDYDAAIGNLISGYPSALVDRGNSIDPSAIWTPVKNSVETPPTAILVNGANFDAANNSLEVSITAFFNSTINNNWKMACVIVEDSVRGTTSGYNQANYYSGGSNGDLIGPDGTNWANLPSSVPASQMVYNHVARAVSPSFNGYNGLPANILVGDSITVNFVFNLSSSWDASKMHIVGMLIKPDGSIDNGSTSTIDEAVNNGYVAGINAGITDYLPGPFNKFNLYPNPVNDNFTIDLNKDYQNVIIKVYNAIGQEVYSEEISNPNQKIKLSADFNAGIYHIEIIANQDYREVIEFVKTK